MNHLNLRIGCPPNAKNPKKDMHSSFGALMTVFKGHLVAAVCTELGISGPDSDIPYTQLLLPWRSQMLGVGKCYNSNFLLQGKPEL